MDGAKKCKGVLCKEEKVGLYQHKKLRFGKYGIRKNNLGCLMFLTASIIGFVLIFDLFTPSQLGSCYDIDTEKVYYVAVTKSGQIRKVMKSYNKEVGIVRRMLVEQLRIESGLLDCFQPNQTKPLKEMKWNAKNYLDVSKYDTKVTTVVLKLDDPALLLDAKSYSLLDAYFPPTFDLSKCSKPDARNPDSNKPFWNPLPRTSIPQIPGEQFDCQRARSMGGHVNYKLSIQYPTNIKSLRLNPSHLAHVHIIRGGIIDAEYGKVCTGSVYIHPEQCDGESPTTVVCSDRFGKLEFYHEVFVATQNWGDLVLHNTLENLPRIALLRDFLRDNVNIKIHIHQSEKTEEILDHLARKNDLKYFKFPHSSASLDLLQIRQMFRRAALVVGVHGPSLSYLIFCKPGTYVVEISCTNMALTSFSNTFSSYVLGLRYHGVMSKTPCPSLTVDTDVIRNVTQFYVDQLKEIRKS